MPDDKKGLVNSLLGKREEKHDIKAEAARRTRLMKQLDSAPSPVRKREEKHNIKAEAARRSRLVKQLDSFTPQEIKRVRLTSGMTQKTFAACIGVSQKSVEAWEGGRS